MAGRREIHSGRHARKLERKFTRQLRKAKSEDEWWEAFVVIVQLSVEKALAEAMSEGVPHHDACRLVERSVNEHMHDMTPDSYDWVPQFAVIYEGDAVVAIRPYAEKREMSE